jgi:hypothetical protein
MGDRFLRVRDVEAWLSVRRKNVYQWVAEAGFRRPELGVNTCSVRRRAAKWPNATTAANENQDVRPASNRLWQGETGSSVRTIQKRAGRPEQHLLGVSVVPKPQVREPTTAGTRNLVMCIFVEVMKRFNELPADERKDILRRAEDHERGGGSQLLGEARRSSAPDQRHGGRAPTQHDRTIFEGVSG